LLLDEMAEWVMARWGAGVAGAIIAELICAVCRAHDALRVARLKRR
jgi:hypothetical protein